jgi:hypothetical protein
MNVQQFVSTATFSSFEDDNMTGSNNDDYCIPIVIESFRKHKVWPAFYDQKIQKQFYKFLYESRFNNLRYSLTAWFLAYIIYILVYSVKATLWGHHKVLSDAGPVFLVSIILFILSLILGVTVIVWAYFKSYFSVRRFSSGYHWCYQFLLCCFIFLINVSNSLLLIARCRNGVCAAEDKAQVVYCLNTNSLPYIHGCVVLLLAVFSYWMTIGEHLLRVTFIFE